MRHAMPARSSTLLLAFLAIGSSFSPREAFAEATFTIVNLDGANEGFNDPTPVAPVGGNAGTTLGQQRLIAFQFAADLWGGLIDSDVDIRIRAAFNPLTCTPTSGVLGAAGAFSIAANSPGTDFPQTWYHGALANKLAGFDIDAGANDDLQAQFNSSIGQPGCLTGLSFYLGLDNNHGSNIDLVTVLLHEFGHGLGFANFVNTTTGANFMNRTDIYSQFTYDETLGVTWASFDPTGAGNASRAASALRCGQLSWSGADVTGAVPGTLLPGTPEVAVTNPSALFTAGGAQYGPALTAAGVSGQVELVNDGTGTTTDGCEALVGFTPGRVAIIDRGTCVFPVKTANAQAAGAVGVIIADNVAGCPPPPLSGTDPSITIPSVRVTQADGATLKANPSAVATLRADQTRRQGASAAGRALLYATNPVQPGSSVSHFESAAFPNLLMEPAINADLNYPLNDVDLTFEQFQDIGWFKADLSVTQSDSADPVVVGANYSYTLQVVNGGAGTNYPVSVTATVPVGGAFVSATGTGWSCGHSAGVVTCARTTQAGADLPTGPAPPITVTVQAPFVPGPVTSNSAVVVPNPLKDPVPANNTDSETTQVNGGSGATITTRTKTVTGTFERDSTVTYTVTIANSGPGAQGDNAGNEFTDVLPAGVTLVNANATSGTAVASIGTNTVTWNGAIASGASVTITITATVNDSNATGATISNQGTISFDADGNGSNEATTLTDDPSVGGSSDPTSFQVAPSLGSYFTLTPCRVIDTRNATGTYGGPALVAGADRTFPLFGQCGIPASAESVSVNLTVVDPSAVGNLRLYPAGTVLPVVSMLNYSAGQTRGNNAIVPLNALGELAARCTQASGTAHFILDVNGYFE
jgi:uncharacterized repeat protein (TIGR01451 family)